MASYVRQRPAGWFWLVGALITFWGCMACAAWVAARSGLAFAPPSAPQGWAFAVAAGSVLGGGIALLSKKRMARTLFVLAGLSAVAEIGWLVAAQGMPAEGVPSAAMAAIVLVVAGGLVWFAEHSRRHGWIC